MDLLNQASGSGAAYAPGSSSSAAGMSHGPASTSSAGATGSANTADDGTRKPKRRRATNGEKKFVCDEPGCGKAFSRPDHLSRHKLNHNPVTTYRCSHAGCPKTFVRLDLLVRHEERHERKLDPEKMAAHKARQAAAQNRAVGGKNEPGDSDGHEFRDGAPATQDGMQPAFSFNDSLTQMPAISSSLLQQPAQHATQFQPQVFGLADSSGSFPAAGPSSMSLPTSAAGITGSHQFSPSMADAQHANGRNLFGAALDNSNPVLHQSQMFPGSAAQMQQGLPQNHLHQQQASQHFSTMSEAGQSQTGSTGQRTDTLDFVQASYGAPFVSASEYDWLFDPTGGFDVSLPASRPASPFGALGNGMNTTTSTAGGVNLDLMSSFNGNNGTNMLQNAQSNGGNTLLNGLSGNNNMIDLPRTFGFAHGGFAPLPHWGPIQEESEPGSQQNSPAHSLNAPSVNSQHSQIPSPAQQQLHQHPSPAQPQLPSPLGQGSPPGQTFPPPTTSSQPSQQQQQQTLASANTQMNQDGQDHRGSKDARQDLQKLASPGGRSNNMQALEKRADPKKTDAPSVKAKSSAAPAIISTLPPDGDTSIHVENETRARVIDYLGPNFRHLRSDNRMSRTAMMEYLELFWSRVHETQAPAVHRASFVAATAPAPLLLSMMLLGCYFASDKAFKLAQQLHPVFRGKVLCSPDFRPRAENWLHQTVLLIIVFGKLCSTRADHEMAHIFWSSCVTLGRRSAIFSQRPIPAFPPGHDDLETQWAAWIDEEVAKRVALIMFGVDVEHAAFFRHSPTLSAFQVQLQLPCDEELWEASTAEEWARIRINSRPALPFISALKASLTAGNASPQLNPFSRIAILHGLLSVAQDLQWRDHVIGLSQPEGRANNWRDMISAAYNSWKSRLDTSLVSATFPTSQLLRASISLYAVAHITLSIDIHELQIYAGAPQALGLIVTAAIYNATEARIKIWAQTKDARAACWHAAFFLRSSLQHYQQTNVDLAGCLHHRWSVYIATLTLYCYGRSTSGEPGPPSNDDEYQQKAAAWLDLMCTHSPEALIDVPRKNESLDLCRVVCEYIEGSRWEIAREGARILGKLQTQNPGPPPSA
ncbi:hypothetical protein ACM66B_005832 [Microbotryomycetes sp. NB124-2]